MKQLSLILFSMMMALCVGQSQDVKWPKMDASPMDAITYPSNAAWRNYLDGEDRNIRPKAKLIYSRPSKKGRNIFGELIPFGSEWRLGANEATTITFYQAVGIGYYTVNPGTYSVFAEVDKGFWTFHFSSETWLWGEPNRDKSLDVATIKVPVVEIPYTQEVLSMAFEEVDDRNIHLVVEWDKSRAYCPISLAPIDIEPLDASPMDMAHYPSGSAFTNYTDEGQVKAEPFVKVLYSRPFKKDRNVFGDVVKMGEVWRIGANQSTEITFYKDVVFGDQQVKKGTYAMYAMVNTNSWDVILSKDFPAWGPNNRDESKDVCKVTNLPVKVDKDSLENLAITFMDKGVDATEMVIGWDKVRVNVPIKSAK